MSGHDTLDQYAKRYVAGLPGKPVSRSGDIPDTLWHDIFHAANGITQTVWGRYPTPQMLQHLHDQGHHTPDAVHQAFGAMPHPHAPGLQVSEYPHYKKAYQSFKSHGKQQA